MQKQIWIIRHAENGKDETEGLHVTERGRVETISMAQKLMDIDIPFPVLIISTPCIRAQETSDILCQEFERHASGSVTQIETMDMRFSSPEEAARIINLISNLDQPQKENEKTPTSIVIICHKNNDAMHLFYAMLDPVKFMAGDASNSSSSDDTLEVLLESLKTNGADEISKFQYLEALGFRYLPQNWSDFDLDCGRHFQTLRPEIS